MIIISDLFLLSMQELTEQHSNDLKAIAGQKNLVMAQTIILLMIFLLENT